MEELNEKDEKLSRSLGSLPLVEAPAGFEGAVRSRIAERRSTAASVARPTLLLALKFALPMVVLVFLGTFLIVSNDATGLAEMIPPVTESGNEIAEFDEKPSDELEPPAVSSNGTSRAANAANRADSSRAIKSPAGSEDFGLSPDETTVFPPGVDPRKANAVNMKPPTGGKISPNSLLSFIGITSACSPVSCTVSSVKEASPAERAGVRVGDVIETIGDRPIDSFRNAAVTVDRLGVVRDGKRITITLVVR